MSGWSATTSGVRGSNGGSARKLMRSPQINGRKYYCQSHCLLGCWSIPAMNRARPVRSRRRRWARILRKTRRTPESLAGVPTAILRQMAAYVAALEVAYPGRSVEAAVLYTQTPRLIAIPDGLLAPFKQALQAAQ